MSKQKQSVGKIKNFVIFVLSVGKNKNNPLAKINFVIFVLSIGKNKNNPLAKINFVIFVLSVGKNKNNPLTKEKLRDIRVIRWQK